MSGLSYPPSIGQRLATLGQTVLLDQSNLMLRGLLALDCAAAMTLKTPPRLRAPTSDGAKPAATRLGIVRQGVQGKRWTGVDLSITNECTFFVIDRFSGTVANNSFGLVKPGGANGHTGIGLYGGTTDKFQFAAAGSGGANFTYDYVVSRADLSSYSARALTVATDGAVRCYVDGALVTTGAIVGPLVARTDIPLCSMGHLSTGAALSVPIDMALGLVWTRALTDAEIKSLFANPWQLFAARERRFALGVATSGESLPGTATGGALAAGSASLSANVGLAGVGVALAGGSAALSAAVPISATGIAVASGSAGLVATVKISASGLAQAAGAAGLSASVLMAGAGAAVASGNAALAAQLAALAAGGAVASGSASLSGGALGAISASGAAVAGGAAALVVSVKLAAAGSAAASGSANLSGGPAGAMSASGSATAGGSAALTASVSLSAAGFVAAMGAGSLSIVAPLSASGLAIAGGAAALGLGGDTITLDPDPLLETLYESRPFGLADDCLLGAAAFTAFLDTADADYFSAQATSHTLRYRLGVPLKTGDPVTVNGTLYRVVGAPRQINTGELRAALVRVPS